jgi:hypothetical protein
MNDPIFLLIGLGQLVFVLWFCGSVVCKLKRSECYLRELLHAAKPNHQYFDKSTNPDKIKLLVNEK